MESQDFPYPEYQQNVVLQINRPLGHVERPTNMKAEVYFYINRDGTVGGLDVRQRSRNVDFDLKAMSAVEAAANRGAFGPLREGWAAERLHIRWSH